MFKINEYFDGRVKSISFNTSDGPATIGVMSEGEYEFGTSSVEYMTVTSGKMDILLPYEKNWKTYNQNETFKIEKNQKFGVRVAHDTTYLCLYR
ncbi:MAG: pyrimidine/purine nucleoside phosphorylase [Bacteroidota bacterium]